MSRPHLPIATLAFDSTERGELGRAVAQQLVKSGCVLVSDLPADSDNAALTHLALSLGVPTTTPVARADKGGDQTVESGFVHRVEALDAPLQNTFGEAVLSTSQDAFDCHTDEYFVERPAEIVMMHCIVADAVGGATILAHVKDVVRRLDDATRRVLSLPLFPHPTGPRQILYGDPGDPTIRFNPHEIRGFYRYAGGAVPEAVTNALAALEWATEQSAVEFHLVPCDCLVLDNRRVLHGRKAFDPSSRRLLKRVRIRTDS